MWNNEYRVCHIFPLLYNRLLLSGVATADFPSAFGYIFSSTTAMFSLTASIYHLLNLISWPNEYMHDCRYLIMVSPGY